MGMGCRRAFIRDDSLAADSFCPETRVASRRVRTSIFDRFSKNRGSPERDEPIAFGATLDLNPLVVLIVTIGAGSLFGMIGMVLAAPLTSAALHINSELVQAKAVEGAERAPPSEPAPDPAAAL
jgi:hypothetical protein